MKRKLGICAAMVFFLAIPFLNAEGSHEVPLEKSAGDRKVLRSLLPEDSERPGWRAASRPEFFESRNLWEYINGQAEMYIDYGFRCVVTVEYSSSDGPGSMIIDVFQMQSPIHAFGIYAAERSPDDLFIKMGAQGYLGKNVLNFWKGPYYVKLTASQSSSDTRIALMRLGNAIANKIQGSFSEPALFACFPDKNRVKMSERFIPRNFLGQPFLENGYRVEYTGGGTTYQIFLIQTDSPEKATEAFRKYQDFLRSRDEKISLSKRDDYQLFFTQGEEGKSVFQYGSFVGGILNSRDLSEAERTIEEIVHKLRNRAKGGVLQRSLIIHRV